MELIVCILEERTDYIRTCYYRPIDDIQGNFDFEAKLYSRQQTLVIREAKTGKIIAKKIFRGSKECPQFEGFKKGEKSTERYSFPNQVEIENWLKNYVVK